MPKFAAEMEQIFDSVFAGSSIDPKTGKMVESDPAAIARADEALKSVIERVAKEKWLVKESAGDSLSHMAGLIKFEELNAGTSSVKAPNKTPVKTPVGESASKKPSLGFREVFENLTEFQGDDSASGLDGEEVVDGDDSFSNAQMGAGDDGAVTGADGDMTMDGSQDPSELGGEDLQGDGMGVDPGAELGGDVGIDGGVDGDNPLDFDLGDLSSFDDLQPEGSSEIGGQATEPMDDEVVPGTQNGAALV